MLSDMLSLPLPAHPPERQQREYPDARTQVCHLEAPKDDAGQPALSTTFRTNRVGESAGAQGRLSAGRDALYLGQSEPSDGAAQARRRGVALPLHPVRAQDGEMLRAAGSAHDVSVGRRHDSGDTGIPAGCASAYPALGV